MKILVLNCGSSSLKFALIELPNYKVLTSGNEERVGINDSFITFRNPERKEDLSATLTFLTTRAA